MKYQWNVAITAQCEPPNTNWRVGRFQICLYWGAGGWKIFKTTRGERPLRHYDISLNTFWKPNKQLNYPGK